MDRKKLVLLIAALVVAVGTALVARSMFAGASAPQAEAAQVQAQGPKVLVAQRALPVGTINAGETKLLVFVNNDEDKNEECMEVTVVYTSVHA